jgi:hypothetical protein
MQRPVRTLVTALAAVCIAGPSATSQNFFVEPDVSVLYTLQSGFVNDNFGWAGEIIGDIDMDGAPDFAITATLDRTVGTANGAVYVYSGRTGSLIKKLTGTPFSRFGHGIAGAGDVDRDGVPDYVVGAPGALIGPAPQIGRVIVYSGATHEPIIEVHGRHHLDFFGWDVNGAGDLNQDGYPDIVAGARRYTGTDALQGLLVTISGRDGSVLWERAGGQANAFLGTGVSGIADVTGDAVPDVAAAADGDGPQGGGRAYVFSGVDGSDVHTLTPNGSTATLFGQFFVHDAGDVDADGTTDVFVADYPASKPNAQGMGQAYVYSGLTGERVRTFIGAPGDGMGPGRGIGDVDGDGQADLVIARWTHSSTVPFGGQVQIFSGQNGKVLRTMTGAQPNWTLGVDALGIGDVNFDGKTDILVTGFGIAHVIAGR